MTVRSSLFQGAMTVALEWPTGSYKDRDFRDHLQESMRQLALSMEDAARGAWTDDSLRRWSSEPIGPGSRYEKAQRRRMRREAREEMARRASGDYPRFRMWGDV